MRTVNVFGDIVGSDLDDTCEAFTEAFSRESGYNRDLDDSGLSGDDVNRRLREVRLGHSAPSADWEDNKGKVIRCIYRNQTVSRLLSKGEIFYHLPLSWAG